MISDAHQRALEGWLARWGRSQIGIRRLSARAGLSRREAERASAPSSTANLLYSKSHTWSGDQGITLTLALNLLPHSRVRAVGVDLEAAGRVVSSRVGERIQTPEELVHGLAPLESWVIKEACFKACRPLEEAVAMSQVRVTEWSVATSEGQWLAGDGRGAFLRLSDAEWTLAAAVLLG